MSNLRKVIILNDDINSARAFLSAVPSAEFYKADSFKNLRKKNKWILEDIKSEVSYFFASRNTDEILILDIELETAPQDGITFLQWFRKKGYTQPVFIYSGHISRLETVEEAREELIKLGLNEDLIWLPVIDSHLKDIVSALINSKNITANDLKNAQDSKATPWRYEYFQEISLRLLIPDDNNFQEVKRIVGLNEQNAEVEGKYEKCSKLDMAEKEAFSSIKNDVAHLLAMPSGTNFYNNELFYRLYMNIYKSLALLCQEQMKAFFISE